MKKNADSKSKNELILYTDKRGNVELRADMEKETIWATLDQIAQLFGRDKSVVSRHLKNIFSSAELSHDSVVAKNATTAADGKTYIVEYYNLDAILSVGYRVNSKQATQFRQWATKTLREYLVTGAVINARRVEQLHEKGIKDVEKKIAFIQNAIRARRLNQSEVDGLLSVINGYTHSWLLLRRYDDGELVTHKSKTKERRRFDYAFIEPAIAELKRSLLKKSEATDIFASERGDAFKAILGTIYQTFGGKELYASIEEKAAHLLYFIIKDHPFTDGNKRVGSFAFIYFMERNGLLYRPNGERKINDNTLVALALLIAESKPAEKDTMIKLVTNLVG